MDGTALQLSLLFHRPHYGAERNWKLRLTVHHFHGYLYGSRLVESFLQQSHDQFEIRRQDALCDVRYVYIRRIQLPDVLLHPEETVPWSLLLSLDPWQVADQRWNYWLHHLFDYLKEGQVGWRILIWHSRGWPSRQDPTWYVLDCVSTPTPNFYHCTITHLPPLHHLDMLLRQGRRI